MAVARVFRELDYRRLGKIYCEKGGELFWKARREPCERLGLQLAHVLLNRLPPGGRSLYVGAGVAELPVLAMERMELRRETEVFTLRRAEALIVTQACRTAAIPLSMQAKDAIGARGWFDHLWIVSVLNDPERFPELAALAYGRANPATFDVSAFSRERRAVQSLAQHCLTRLRLPALVTTSVEEIPWITEWCVRQEIPFVVEPEDYPTALVQDPVCFIRLGSVNRKRKA
jgi:hypothetical protein